MQTASVAWTPLPGALLLGTSAYETLGGRQLEGAAGMQASAICLPAWSVGSWAGWMMWGRRGACIGEACMPCTHAHDLQAF